MAASYKKVFITGAAGFIGKALLNRFKAAGSDVVGLDIHGDRTLNIVAGDLMQPNSWQEYLRDCDLLIHTAAVVSNTANWDVAWNINVEGTRLLLDAAASAGVKRFLHLSSVAACGFTFKGEINEDIALKPIGNVYVDSKIASEHSVLAMHAAGQLDCTIVRPTDVYGPGSRPWVVLPIEAIRSGRFLLPAYGEGQFSPVYIDNLVDGVVLAATKPEGRGQIFNIGDGTVWTCRYFFNHYYEFLGLVKPVKTLPTAVARVLAELVQWHSRLLGKHSEVGGGTIDMLSRKGGYDISKARQLLGYAPLVSLDQGMEHTRDWLLKKGYLD